jgi:hypothetical protein
VWVFVDVLDVSKANMARIRKMSLAVAVSMWLAYLIGGYWYVFHYSVDKALILKGPWPFSHNFFMETKEHIVLMLLLMTTFLPIAASNDLTSSKPARKLVLLTSALIIVIAVAVDGEGAIIAMGVKVATLLR